MERGLKLVLSERLVIDASRTHHAGTFSEKRTAHVKCRWITEASLLLKNPFFPHPTSLNCLFVTLPIFSFFFPPYLYNCFLLDFSIFPSSHMLLAQSQLSLLSQSNVLGHTSGIPWQGSPLPSLHHHPQHFFLMGLTGSRSFVGLRLCLLKKQNWCRTKTMRGGLSFISGPSGGSTWSCSRPLSALNCTTAFINYQLISSKYDYLCSHADD